MGSGYLSKIAFSLGVKGTQVNASSGSVSNATATATLPAVSGKTNYITGFEVTGTGVTALGVSGVTVTVTGTLGGTLSYVYAAASGVAVANTPLLIEFPEPVQASAVNTAIVVSCPALGAGNVGNAVVAHGFVL